MSTPYALFGWSAPKAFQTFDRAFLLALNIILLCSFPCQSNILCSRRELADQIPLDRDRSYFHYDASWRFLFFQLTEICFCERAEWVRRRNTGRAHKREDARCRGRD